nr:immunoglobulin heavy chain junction region [Macaca mulatta]
CVRVGTTVYYYFDYW